MNKAIKCGYYDVNEISEYIGCSKGHAYKIMKKLNDELRANGYITVAGKVSKAYFHKKYYGCNENT